VYSVNVPVPPAVERVAASLHGDLHALDSVRERHTLVAKRLGDPDSHAYPVVEKRARRALRGSPAFEARVTGIETFDNPAAGVGPVVYLAVESPALLDLHRRLAAEFDPAPGVEGDDYVPHVTLGRGGNPATVARLRDRDIEPVTWTVSDLAFYDASHRERVGTVSLPA
jgi:2'-5' RNA ligase